MVRNYKKKSCLYSFFFFFFSKCLYKNHLLIIIFFASYSSTGKNDETIRLNVMTGIRIPTPLLVCEFIYDFVIASIYNKKIIFYYGNQT